jgi:hypothetical protein
MNALGDGIRETFFARHVLAPPTPRKAERRRLERRQAARPVA